MVGQRPGSAQRSVCASGETKGESRGKKRNFRGRGARGGSSFLQLSRRPAHLQVESGRAAPPGPTAGRCGPPGRTKEVRPGAIHGATLRVAGVSLKARGLCKAPTSHQKLRCAPSVKKHALSVDIRREAARMETLGKESFNDSRRSPPGRDGSLTSGVKGFRRRNGRGASDSFEGPASERGADGRNAPSPQNGSLQHGAHHIIPLIFARFFKRCPRVRGKFGKVLLGAIGGFG